MAEAVHFYWAGRETEIPLTAVPEKDRDPLVIRRSVVQACAPAVLKQLEEGGFIGASWDSSGQISLILCHPNLARGAVDGPLLNTAVLPRVAITAGNWDEVPEVAGLLLTAFGAEAATVEECAAARRDLAEWLTRHDQADMAAVVRRLSSFPFGVKSDALEVINSWRNVLIRGRKGQIDSFLTEVGRRFENLNWSREPKREALLNGKEHSPPHLYCWVSPPESRPRIALCINRTTERVVRGETYIVLDERGGLTELARVIQYVLAEVLEPAASAAGLSVAYPRLGPISRVGPRTTAALTLFAEAGDGQWPILDELETVWRNVVVTAFREDVAIKPEELSAWFTASGWDETASAELTRRFSAEAALLGEYEEAGRQAV